MIDNGTVTRLKCRKNLTEDDIKQYNISGEIDPKLEAEFKMRKFKNDTMDEDAIVKLEQDRIFHTCHLLPTKVQK